jgi:hypothetical protein
MTLLKTMNEGPGDFPAQWNELVRRFRQLEKINGDGNVRVDMVQGVPCLSLRKQPTPPKGIPFRDDSDTAAIEHAIMRITGKVEIDGVEHLTVIEPDNETPDPNNFEPGNYAINIGDEVPGSITEGEGEEEETTYSTGRCVLATDSVHWPLKIAYENVSNSVDPEFGQFVGPGNSSASWKVTNGAPGFLVLDFDSDNDVVLVRPMENQDLKVRAVFNQSIEGDWQSLKAHGCAAGFILPDTTGPRGGEPVLHTITAVGDQWGRLSVFNSHYETPAGNRAAFVGEPGIARPVMALIKLPTGAVSPDWYEGALCGPLLERSNADAEAGQYLYPGLYGFRMLSEPVKEDDDDEFGRAWVIADDSPMTVVSKYNCPHTSQLSDDFVVARPVAAQSRGSYDEYDGASDTYPLIEISVDLRRPMSLSGGDGNASHLVPNVRIGQTLLVRRIRWGRDTTSMIWIPVDANHLDDPIGTIKLWHGNNIPSGWQVCDGTNGTVDLRGKFPAGFLSGDADFGTVGGSGGAKTHTHTAHGTTAGQSGTGITALTATNNHSTTSHLPPYATIKFIERVAYASQS